MATRYENMKVKNEKKQTIYNIHISERGLSDRCKSNVSKMEFF